MITCEYPPELGGVAAYTHQLAEALAARGLAVAVFAPGDSGVSTEGAVTVARVAGTFGPLGLWRVSRELDRRGRAPLLVQYVPTGFGWRGLNFWLPLWLVWRSFARRDRVVAMVHEVAVPFFPGANPANVLAVSHRLMALMLGAACAALVVTVPRWRDLLRGIGVWRATAVNPVPANLPESAIGELRRRGPAPTAAARVVGHFGTYGRLVTGLLEPALTELLTADPTAQVVLVGPSEKWAPEWLARRSQFAARVRTFGRLTEVAVAEQLAGCAVLLQPYPDGGCGRRTTLMAGVALGVPVVTTDGPATEPAWRGGAVCLVPADKPDRLAGAVRSLLDDPARRAEMSARAASLYDAEFALSRHIDRLLVVLEGPRR